MVTALNFDSLKCPSPKAVLTFLILSVQRKNMGQRNIKTMYYIVLEHRHPMKSIPLLFFSYLKDHNHPAILFLTSCENLLSLVLFVACLISLSLLTSSFHLGLQGSLLAIHILWRTIQAMIIILMFFSPTLSFLVNDSPSTFEHAICMLRDNSCSS